MHKNTSFSSACFFFLFFQAKASRESAAGKSGALRALLEASAPGGALHGAGVCGRLGDLGAIGADYDVAVRFNILRLEVEMRSPFSYLVFGRERG